MREKCATPKVVPTTGEVARFRVLQGGLAVPTLAGMAKTPASETEETPGDTERRARLIHWIKDGMRRQKVKSIAALAKGMGAPYSSVHRWLNPEGTAPFPMVWLGPLCRTLRLDPMVIALLLPIPVDPLAPYVLTEDDPFVVALDAARLGTLDAEAEAAVARPAASTPRARPRARAAQGGR